MRFAAALLAGVCMAAPAAGIDSMWEYSDPVASERRLSEALGRGRA